ncbi:hypothetical protein [Clostridium butyricum]|uniref:hypothetical protein n=1 Tax=Clostridium butyricum TaxID=1492 RepID=UPI002ABD67D9|nr:hypothetical protein [Clostridium butyricum]
MKNLKSKVEKLMLGIKENTKKICSVITMLLVIGKPAYAMEAISIDGMSAVAQTLKNFLSYGGMLMIAGGTVTVLFGGYQFAQSFKAQDSESKHKSMLEVGGGAIAIAVGIGAATKLASYITMAV